MKIYTLSFLLISYCLDLKSQLEDKVRNKKVTLILPNKAYWPEGKCVLIPEVHINREKENG